MKSAASRQRVYHAVVPVLFMLFHQYVLNAAARFRFERYLDQIDPARTLYDYADAGVLTSLQMQADIQSHASFYMSLIVIPVYILYLNYRHGQTRSMPRLQRIGADDVVSGFAIMTGALGLVTLWMALLGFLAEKSSWLRTMLDEYRDLAQSIVPEDRYRFIVVITLVVLVPVAEELLFRGIMQGELAQILPEKWAIVFTLIFFSLFHINPIQISYVIVPAFALSAVYALTKNLLIPIVMHIWFNFAGSGLLAGLTDNPALASEILFYTEILFIAVGALSLVRLIKKARAQNAITAPGKPARDGFDHNQ